MFEETSSGGCASPADNPAAERAYPALKFDPAPYLHHLADAELTDAQKAELLETLWQIMVHFVDLGMGIGPIRQAMDKSPKKETSLEARFQDVVKPANKRTSNNKAQLRPAPHRQS